MMITPSFIKRRFQTLLEFLRYGVVGLIGTFLHTAVMILLVEKFRVNPFLASNIGFCFSLVVSFVLNVVWTFKAQFHVRPFLRYTIISILGQLLNLVILYLFVNIVGFKYIVGHTVALVIVPIVNFILNKLWAFRK